jgi:hypothetical protein
MVVAKDRQPKWTDARAKDVPSAEREELSD